MYFKTNVYTYVQEFSRRTHKKPQMVTVENGVLTFKKSLSSLSQYLKNLNTERVLFL